MDEIPATEKAQIEKVLIRHHFVVVGDGDQGFCAGPYCAGEIVSREQHAAHVADALLRLPPDKEVSDG